MRATESIHPYAASTAVTEEAWPETPATGGALVRCVRLDPQGRPYETFAGHSSILDDGCVVVTADRPVRVGERLHLAFSVAGRELNGAFVATRSVASFRPGREPEYRLLLELDEDAGVDFGALLGDQLPDGY